LQTAARYKYVIDVSALFCLLMLAADIYAQVDGNEWLSRFKCLTNSGSLIFKATTYPERCVPFSLF
jgi:hypothetical protein